MSSIERAKLSLEGLSVGDAFGENFFAIGTDPMLWRLYLSTRKLPPGTWRWTDDTEMASAIVDVLCSVGTIDADVLAIEFAARYASDDRRGYGGTAHQILRRIVNGVDWRIASVDCFGGTGSLGNGAAMRAAPIGAYFADRPVSEVIEQATLSALPTHAHREGQLGAVAIALAAAKVASGTGVEFDGVMRFVLDHLEQSQVRQNVELAMKFGPDASSVEVAERCGNGTHVTAPDTVGFALWSAAAHLNDFEAAMWATVEGGGDIDTNCAIVGGIVSLVAGVSDSMKSHREPLRLNR
jgi:ADP-ribosylglycohydrolase